MKSFQIFLSIIIVFSMLAAGGAKAGKASVDIGERKDTGGDLELVARFNSTNLLNGRQRQPGVCGHAVQPGKPGSDPGLP